MLGESNKSHTTPMDPKQIATMFVEINAKLDTLKTFEERLTKVKTMVNHLSHPQVVKFHRTTDITTSITHPILMLNV